MKTKQVLTILLLSLFSTISYAQNFDLAGSISIIYQEGFENNNHGWSTSNVVWEVGKPTSGPNKAYSGTNCAATVLGGNYPHNTDSRFLSPYIVIPEKVNEDEILYLSLWEWHYIWLGDITQLEIKKREDSTWKQFGTNYVENSGTWTNTKIDITEYFGSTIQLSFWHNEDGRQGTQIPGLYIDDIEIRIEPPRKVEFPKEIISWKQMSLGGPLPRRDSSITFDSKGNETVLFGGRTDTEFFGDTWSWNAQSDSMSWTQLSSSGPAPRYGAAMAYDSKRDRTVLFGGSSGTRFADTWEWNGIQWTDITTSVSPTRRTNAAMAYDKNRSRIVLFGGADGLTRFGETWEWDGATWTKVTSDGPAPRAECGMVYDEENKKIILFGGRDTGNYYNDMWEYDGKAWKQITVSNSPSARTTQSSLAYDSLGKCVVLYGGSNETGSLGNMDQSRKEFTYLLFLHHAIIQA